MAGSTSRAMMCLLTAGAAGVAVILAGVKPAVHAAGKGGQVEAQPAQNRELIVNQVMGLTDSQLIAVNVDLAPDRNIWTPITIDGQQFTMDLEAHTIRTPGYTLKAQQADGSWIVVDPGPDRTLRGSLDEVPGSKMAASMLEDGLHGSVMMPDGHRWWFEPLLNRIPNAAGNDYVLYRDSDVIHPEGGCGTVNDAAAMMGLPGIPAEGEPGGGISGGITYCAEIACDADVEYYVAHGSSVLGVQNAINAVLNQMDIQYLTQTDIDHVVTTILVRTTEPDPYTTAVAGSLLNQFRNEWLANQGAIPRDVAHLFTGKNMSAASGGTIGIAFLCGVCNGNGYSVVQSDCCGSFACATDLSAHELGHNWCANHCSVATGSTMNASLTCVNTFLGCNPDSVAAIVSYRNSIAPSCLSTCADAALPFSDNFPALSVDSTKWTTIVNCSNNTGGNNEPSAPYSLNLKGGISSDATQIRSARINTSGLPLLQLSFKYQQQGAQNDPEAGDDLVLEYLNNVGTWVEANRQFGNAAVQPTYTNVTVVFPADAKHADFRIRFRNTSFEQSLDDWYVDDVFIVGSPANDLCSAAQNVTAGSHAFLSLAANTDGPDETGGCGVGQLSNDIWYRFGPTCAPGTVTASVCGADFDTRMAVYLISCPGGPGNTIGCNDNACGDDASVSVHVNLAQLLRIRVGGNGAGAAGSGTLVITCTPDPVCPEDVNHDGSVNITDLLAVIAAWGTNNADADINDDGTVNITDLLAVIAGWGPC